jgi:hypothetical protein
MEANRMIRLIAMTLMAVTLAMPAAAIEKPSDKRSAAALAQMLGDLKYPPKLDDVTTFVLKPWPASPTPKLWVGAAIFPDLNPDTSGDTSFGGAFADTPIKLWVGIFGEDGQGLTLLASSFDNPPYEGEVQDDTLALDLIPYRISESEVAFGVRFENYFHRITHYVFSQGLQLYRYHERSLRPIFSASTKSKEYDESEPSWEECDECEQHIVAFSPNRTEGFFDLLLRDKRTHKTERHVWTGEAYEAAPAP